MLKQFIADQMIEFIKRGGVKATNEHVSDRLSVCSNCPFLGMVQPDPFLPLMEGCTACGCPSATKPHMVTHWRRKDKKHEPLTREEMVEVSVMKKLNRDKYEEVVTECPKGKWSDVDFKHKDSYK